MSKMPKVSVIIPCHNEEATILESVYSFINQTYLPTEIIVVNDGSTDSTNILLEGFKERLVCCFNLEKNKGPAAARNFGAREAKGEFLVFAEADGKYSAEYLEGLIKKFDGSIAGVIGGLRRVWTLRNSFLVRYQNYRFEVMHRLTTLGIRPLIGAWAFPKKIFLELGGYDERYRIGEDVELVDRIKARKQRIGWSPEGIIWHKDPDTLRKYLNQYFRKEKKYSTYQHPPFFSKTYLFREIAETIILAFKKKDYLIVFVPILLFFITRVASLLKRLK
jgi:glycosyltransferase involved in cell wall biosynthesis